MPFRKGDPAAGSAASKRRNRRGGRSKVIRECAYCEEEFSAKELLAHEPKCSRKAVGTKHPRDAFTVPALEDLKRVAQEWRERHSLTATEAAEMLAYLGWAGSHTALAEERRRG